VHANFSLEAEARGIRTVYDRLWTEGQKPLGLSREGEKTATGAKRAGNANEIRYQHVRRNHVET
jgi:hypothetical protein